MRRFWHTPKSISSLPLPCGREVYNNFSFTPLPCVQLHNKPPLPNACVLRDHPPTLSLVWTSNVSSSERWWFVSLIAQIGGASSIPIRRQQHVVPLRPRSREREEWFSASEREVRRRRNRCLFLPILSLSSILSVLPNLRPSSSSFSSFVQEFLFCQVDHGLFFPTPPNRIILFSNMVQINTFYN